MDVHATRKDEMSVVWTLYGRTALSQCIAWVERRMGQGFTSQPTEKDGIFLRTQTRLPILTTRQRAMHPWISDYVRPLVIKPTYKWLFASLPVSQEMSLFSPSNARAACLSVAHMSVRNSPTAHIISTQKEGHESFHSHPFVGQTTACHAIQWVHRPASACRSSCPMQSMVGRPTRPDPTPLTCVYDSNAPGGKDFEHGLGLHTHTYRHTSCVVLHAAGSTPPPGRTYPIGAPHPPHPHWHGTHP